MEKIKFRAMLYAMGIVILLVALFISSIIQDKQRVLEEKTAAHRQLLSNSYELAVLDTEKGLSAFAAKIASDRSIVDAFASRDREKLYALTLPILQESERREEVDLVGFIANDGHHFLRMKDPKKFGDDITKKRPIIAHALQTRKPVVSLDVTIYDVALVSIIPIFKENEFIGILQTSAKIDRIQNRLNAHSGIKSAIAFDTKKLSSVLPDKNYQNYHGYSLVSYNDRLFTALPKSFLFYHDEQKNEGDYGRFGIDGVTYIVAYRHLHNYKNEHIAMMACALDITADEKAYEDEITNLLLISLILLGIMGFILNFGFALLIRRINRQTDFSKAITSNMGEGLIVLDTSGTATVVNKAALEMLEYKEKELIGQDVHDIIHPCGVSTPDLNCPIIAVEDERYRDTSASFTTKSGKLIDVDITATPLIRDGKKEGVIVVFSDVTEQRLLNKQLQYQLYNDPLTGLPNRNALLRDLKTNRSYALILLNIDNFKEINDFYGHKMGDHVLVRMFESIQNVSAILPVKLYKMPSDEFALIVTERLDAEAIEKMALEIIHRLHDEHYEIEGISIYVTVTMGMDICQKIAFDVNETPMRCDLLVHADMALKLAKRRQLPYFVYSDSMNIKEEYQKNILWSKKLKSAIEERRFCLYYQPVHSSRNGDIYEYEALIRMIDEDGAVISPFYFLQAAKKSHLYSELTRFVIDSAFMALKTTDHRISVNLSVDDILDSDTTTHIFETLGKSHYGDRLIFELLESEGIENYQEVSAFIAKVKSHGCLVAIDDFGTGYSNFAHILRLNVDILKIDGSLIRHIDTDKNAQTIVKTVVDFARRLDIKTVAEFVHSEAVYDQCLSIGVDYVQGYHLSEPKATFSS